MTWSADQLDAQNRLITTARLMPGAVHEAGNALQVISGNAEMIAARPADAEKAGERAQRIKTQSDRAGARLHAFAVLATAEVGPPRHLDLRRLADRALDLCRYSFGRARISASIDGLESGAIIGDEPELVRLIANLLLNAEHAVTHRTEPAIRLSVSRLAGTLALSVTDNGPGVPPERAETIFQPFAPDRAPGCGLAVARWLAEKHGGTLVLDQGHTGGARFVLTLSVAM
jgi:signal transduction histidine kinase